MTLFDDNVTPLPTLLERLGLRIDQAWHRTLKGDAEWVEGSLELAQVLAEGRERFPSDVAFGKWLTESGHKHFNEHARAALIGFASDMALAREILTKSESRSYELLWRRERDRFASIRKPTRGRPRGSRNKRQRMTDPVKDQIIELADQGLSPTVIAADVGVKPRAVSHELERENIRRETMAELLGVAAEKFSEKGKLTIDDAIRIHQKRLDKQFEQVVNTEVRKRIDAANDHMRSSYARLSADNINLTRMIGQRGVFTERQFRHMLMLCHPDSSAGPEIKAELLQVLVENKNRLVRPDKP